MPIAPLPPLPSRWVDALFTKLTVIYGHDFLRRYEGLPMDEVKAEWAERLSGFHVQPEAIAHALSVLPPDRPPTILGFVDLCRRAPMKTAAALPAPPQDPAAVKRAAAALKALTFRPKGDTTWAHRLQEREQRSADGLTQFQRDAWREALGQAKPQELAA